MKKTVRFWIVFGTYFSAFAIHITSLIFANILPVIGVIIILPASWVHYYAAVRLSKFFIKIYNEKEQNNAAKKMKNFSIDENLSQEEKERKEKQAEYIKRVQERNLNAIHKNNE